MSWYSKYLQVYNKDFDALAYRDIIQTIKENIKKINSTEPLVTVSVIAYNEEKHLLSCLWALSEMETKYPIEIIGVDNDSSDKTAEIFQTLDVPYFSETQHSCGFARLCGLRHARGKYHVNIDADTLYPKTYIDNVIDIMEKDSKVMGVSATWGYYPDANNSHLSLFLYTRLRDFYLWLQSFKRPELSVRGLVFSYRTAEALKVGIRTDIKRGEDGTLAFNLKNYGKLAFIRNSKVRAITGYGTVGKGSTLSNFLSRAIQSGKRIGSIFHTAKHYEDKEDNLIKH